MNDGTQERTDRFTPGPWERVGSVVRTHRDTTGGFLIADCTRAELGGGQGNARLIAAAPDMYAALGLINELTRECLLGATKLADDDWRLARVTSAIACARAAIARAEGRP